MSESHPNCERGGVVNDFDLIVSTCDWGDCDRRADSLRFDERLGGLIPVCWRHITAYRIGKGGTGLWQAEDEFAGLRFCRRSRWRWLAQRRILADQRAAMSGRVSRAQVALAAVRAHDEAVSGDE